MATVLSVLKKAEKAISSKGWCQGWYAYATTTEGHRVRCNPCYDCAECFCLGGAIYRAMAEHEALGEPDPLIMATLRRLETTIANLYGVPMKVPVWNDKASRTKEEVLDLLRAAIADEAAGAPLVEAAA